MLSLFHDAFARQRTIIFGLLALNIYFVTQLYNPSAAISLQQVNQVLESNPQSDSQIPTTAVSAHERLQPIVFSLVMFGAVSATEGIIGLKSVLMHASRPIDFHIITSEDAIPVLESRLNLISRPPYPINVYYYPLKKESIRERASRAGVDTKYDAGLGGLVKVFIHEILPTTVTKSIFFDTDMIFVTDPYLLWRRFDTFTGSQIISFPDSGPNSGAMEICTCAMLLDLEGMRNKQTPFMPSTLFKPDVQPLANKKVFKKQGIDPLNPAFGDQGLYWAVWNEYPQYFQHLSLSWDTSHCQFAHGLTLQGPDTMTEQEHIDSQIRTYDAIEEFKQLFPGIIHFNCQPDKVTAWDNTGDINRRLKRWGSVVSYILDYKWVWMNKGDGHAKISTFVDRDVVFWDERLARNVGHRQAPHHHH